MLDFAVMRNPAARVLVVLVAAAAGCSGLVDIDNTEVARVDGQKILLRDVLARISQTPPQSRLKASSRAGREGILDDLINESLLLGVADAAGIIVPEAELRARMEQERQAMAQRTGDPTALPLMRDAETIERILRIEKALESVMGFEAVQERYEQLHRGPPRDTVQYDFVLVRATNPNLAQEAEVAFNAGTTAAELIAQFRSHPDFLNGGRTDPIYTQLLAPWLRRELGADPRPGTVLPPYKDDTSGQPAFMVVRLINRWSFPPMAAIYESLVEELYEDYIAELRAQHAIERYPDRLTWIERR